MLLAPEVSEICATILVSRHNGKNGLKTSWQETGMEYTSVWIPKLYLESYRSGNYLFTNSKEVLLNCKIIKNAISTAQLIKLKS